MKIQKEGLKIYRVEESVQSEYFLSVEYQTLRLNQPDTLIPVLLREKDGRRLLLYDITEGKNLLNITDGKGFSWEDCRHFLKNVLKLMDEVEEFMLELEHVSFEPEQIYRKDEEHFQWMYFPDRTNDIRQEIESFFAWMLSQIDYGDSESVRYIYHVYWSIRNRGFSREMIEDSISYSENSKDAGTIACEEFVSEKETEVISERDEDTEDLLMDSSRWQHMERSARDLFVDKDTVETYSKKNWIVFMIGLLVLLIITLLLTAYFLISWIQNDFPNETIPYLAGLGMGILFLLDGIFQSGKKWLKKEDRKAGKEDSRRREEVSRKREEDSRTTILSVRHDVPKPVLKSLNTGEITGLFTFPFYIGNLSGLNQLIIDDDTVSRQHAVILKGKHAGTYIIQDLQSTNGTWVEEERLLPDKPVRLEDGNRICFASQYFQFMMVEAHL